MFDNVGGKIKGLAKISCWIGIICSVIVGIVIVVIMKSIADKSGNESHSIFVLIAAAVIAIGSFWSWLLSLGVYGFGELIENSRIIVENTSGVPRLSDRIIQTLQANNVKNATVSNIDENEETNTDYIFEGHKKATDGVIESSLMDSKYSPYDQTIKRLRMILAVLSVVIVMGLIILFV